MYGMEELKGVLKMCLLALLQSFGKSGTLVNVLKKYLEELDAKN